MKRRKFFVQERSRITFLWRRVIENKKTAPWRTEIESDNDDDDDNDDEEDVDDDNDDDDDDDDDD